MHTFTFIVRPRETTALYTQVGGAYAVVLVNDPRAETAEAAARALVESSGWEIEALDDWGPVGESGLSPEGAELAHHAEALETGRSIVFHTWPINEDVTG